MLNTYKQLNEDQKQILGGVGVFVCFFIFLFWLVSTNTLPVFEVRKDEPKQVKKSYELRASYLKYSQRVYTEKYEN